MATSLAAPRPAPWFRSPAYDAAFVLLTPLWTYPLVRGAEAALGAPLLNRLILLSATGHYVATFARAYGDLDLLRRFRTRLLVAPLALIVLCVGMFATGHEAPLLVATTAWAFWHWLAQGFGFARIYDAKIGSHAPWTALLDKALVTAGFVGTAVLNPASTAMFGKVFLDAGLPLPGAATWAVVQRIVLGGCVLTAVLYLADLGLAIARGRPWSWQKQVMHASTIGYYVFAFSWLPNVLVAYVLFELFHDIQYYAITWLACRQRATRPGTAGWFQLLFRPGPAAAALFVGAMYACGGLDALGRANLEGPGRQAWLGVFLCLALLHYYYDGFVWKTRERLVGADLGVTGGRAATRVGLLRHAATWSLFVLPLLGALVFGGPPASPRVRAEALVAVAPGDFLSRADLAFELVRARELPQAFEHYRASIAANPDFAQSRANFGNALDLAGDLDGAREQYEAALRCPDRDGAHRQAHTGLGVLLLVRGDRKGADEHLRAAMALGGENPLGRLLGLAAAVPPTEIERRSQLLRAALQLDPNQPDAHFQLGLLLLERQETTEAIGHLQTVVQTAPQHVPALVALAKAFVATGQMEAARPLLQQALQREPANPEALDLQGRIGR